MRTVRTFFRVQGDNGVKMAFVPLARSSMVELNFHPPASSWDSAELIIAKE
jgi:hypothetical protein